MSTAQMSTVVSKKGMLIISCLIGVVAMGALFWCSKQSKSSETRYYRNRDAARKNSMYRGVRYHDATTTDSSELTTDSSGLSGSD